MCIHIDHTHDAVTDRIHLVVEEADKERYRREAEREGVSLSEWLRDAARRKLAEADARAELDTLEKLRDFFAACDRRERGREPDWQEHRRVIEESLGGGGTKP